MHNVMRKEIRSTLLECADIYIKHGNNTQVRKTTKGWQLCVEPTRWDRLIDLKESNPVDFAECPISKNLHDAPAFVWWVPRVLKKRSHIIDDVTKTNHNRTHKFGIQVPMSWDDCARLDTDNGNTLWQDIVRKDMKNVRIAFKIVNGDEAIPPTYQDIHCHIMIFDFKMEDFRRKARFVDGGHTTDTPCSMTYASNVS
jgi:hypothetical protein